MFADEHEPGNAGDDSQNLQPTDLDDEQIEQLIEDVQAELDAELTPV